MPRTPHPIRLRPTRAGLRLALSLCVAGLLAACTSIGPYTLDIQQGIVVDQKMIDRLKPGMTRNQVSLALGTPLLTDPLHAERWDYVYYTRHGGKVGEWRRFTCVFKQDRLALVTGDVTVLAADAGVTPPAVPAAGKPDAGGLPAPVPDSSGLPAPAPDSTGKP